MISDAVVVHTLVEIFVADPNRRDLVESAAWKDLVATTDAKWRKETHSWYHAAKSFICPSLLRHTVHCLIGQIDFWSSVQR